MDAAILGAFLMEVVIFQKIKGIFLFFMLMKTDVDRVNIIFGQKLLIFMAFFLPCNRTLESLLFNGSFFSSRFENQ